MGYRIVLYANAALQAAIAATRRVLSELHGRGSLQNVAEELASFSERQRIVRKHEYDRIERQYAVRTEKE
jgi:2-methylisocitrate lyase-like PEP mutase family enzyme